MLIRDGFLKGTASMLQFIKNAFRDLVRLKEAPRLTQCRFKRPSCIALSLDLLGTVIALLQIESRSGVKHGDSLRRTFANDRFQTSPVFFVTSNHGTLRIDSSELPNCFPNFNDLNTLEYFRPNESVARQSVMFSSQTMSHKFWKSDGTIDPVKPVWDNYCRTGR
jgi:hypothetical protein